MPITTGRPANSSISRSFQLSPIAITSSRGIPRLRAHSPSATPLVTPSRSTSSSEKSRAEYSVSARVNSPAMGSASSRRMIWRIGSHGPVYITCMGSSPFRQSTRGSTSAMNARFRRKYPPRCGSSQSTRSIITCRSRGRSNTTAAMSRNSGMASSTRRAVALGSKSRWCVSPSFDLISAPLFTIKCRSQGSASAIGRAKSKRRPVTSTISMPREAASPTVRAFSSGTCPRLSSSVPSMSIAINRIAMLSFYLVAAVPQFTRR